jgi:hypothetical protein
MSEFNPEPLDHYSYRQPLKIRQYDSHLYSGLQPVLVMCMFTHVDLTKTGNQRPQRTTNL